MASDSDAPPLCVVWYDPNVCEKAHETAIEILQQNIGHVTMLKDQDDGNHYFGRDFSKKRAIVITTGQLGQILVPKIHHLSGVISIYIYCENDEAHKEWTTKYPKVGNSLLPSTSIISVSRLKLLQQLLTN